jgi:hypothetical protein
MACALNARLSAEEAARGSRALSDSFSSTAPSDAAAPRDASLLRPTRGAIAPGPNDVVRPVGAPAGRWAAGCCRIADTRSRCRLDRSAASLASFAGCDAASSYFWLDSDGSSFTSSTFCGAGLDTTSRDSATGETPGAVHTPYAVNEIATTLAAPSDTLANVTVMFGYPRVYLSVTLR